MIYLYPNFPKAKTVCVTGHRPKTIQWTYDLNDRKWLELGAMFRKMLVESGCTDAWTGMALGVDTVFAQSVLDLKNAGHDIKLHCAIPFEGQESKWRPESVGQYNAILSRADENVIVSPGGYAGFKMTERDHYMVDRSDLVIAVWNGTNSGTGRCVQYASNKGRSIVKIDPYAI